MNSPVPILYLEDNPRDVELVRDKLQQIAMSHELRIASDRAEYEAALAQTRFDLILSDYSLPGYDGMTALALAREKQPGVPFIIISGTLGDEQAVDCVVRGATDYVLKKNLNRLVPAVLRALTEAEENQKRRVAEAALRGSEDKYRGLFESSRDALMTLEPPSWRFTAGNPAAVQMFGAKNEEEFISRGPWELSPERQPDGRESAEKAKEMIETALREGSHFFEWTHRRIGGEEFPADVLLTRMEQSGKVLLQSSVRDITERKLAEAQREKLEEQLRMSQKMEAIGSLAGGVAHDFNNLLSVILSYTGFAMEGARDGDPLKNDLLEVKNAGERAAALTRQLLAFSRKLVLQPAVLSLNQIATGVEKMLQRILGEDIDLVQTLAPDLGLTLADPGQIEQVLMNLVVNARDAMPEGGKLTIETSNVEIDEEYAARHVAVKPGPYVQLAISDTGCGMDEQTRARIFEPFFTTKEKGKGTGLGMSTVFGIVKQSGGNIWVYSELGQGTTFKVYLPRELSATTPTDIKPVTITTRSKGTETILVVEDEEALLKVALRTLGASGYKVLTASNGDEGLLVSAQHVGEIHMLLTDVVMPRMSGRVLAQQISKARPSVKVVYMSGYTDNAIVHHGVLDAGTHFLAKPFTSADLARKVREVLDEGISSLADGQEHAATDVAEVKEEQPLDKAALGLLTPDVRARLRKAVIAARYNEIVKIIDGGDPLDPGEGARKIEGGTRAGGEPEQDVRHEPTARVGGVARQPRRSARAVGAGVEGDEAAAHADAVQAAEQRGDEDGGEQSGH